MDRLEQLEEQKKALIRFLKLNLKMHVGNQERREQLTDEFLDEINRVNRAIEDEKRTRGR